MKELLERFAPIKKQAADIVAKYKNEGNKGIVLGQKQQLSSFYASLASLTGQLEAMYIRAESARKQKYWKVKREAINETTISKAEIIAENETKQEREEEANIHAEYKELRWLCDGLKEVLNAMANQIKYEQDEKWTSSQNL
jgi:hypothetical protein